MSVSAEPPPAGTWCVAPDRIAAIWPHVAPWLTAAADRCGDWTADALRELLLRGEALLWVLWDGQALCAACVTEAVGVPRGRILRVLACGGRRLRNWVEALAPIEAYARDLGCRAIRIEGRRGWQRVLPDYRLAWICIEKEL
jgi:hypothetical protein